MKIISKHKDYYDHLVALYGYDDSRVYDRRNTVLPPTDFSCPDNIFVLSICGEYIPVLKRDGKFIFKRPKLLNWCDGGIFDLKDIKSKENVKFRQPILLCDRAGRAYENFVPSLMLFGIPSIIDAHIMYQKIYDFLGWLKDNPVPPNNQTSKEKVIAHGFDVKTSFRPKMKKKLHCSKI